MRHCGLSAMMLLTLALTADAGWKAGVAKVDITPAEPMWMSGYAARTHEATGELTRLWAKALVLEDDAGRQAVVITLDLVGIDRQTSLDIRRQLMDAHDLTLADVAICTSHTHSGPVVGSNLIAMYDLDPTQITQITEYTKHLQQQVIRIVGEALESLTEAELAGGIGRSTFAVNRRENRAADVETLRAQGELQGPVDHEVPVLRVRVGGETKAIVFGYACHATTLSGYEWCGDWPGYAQIELEKAHPQATALFFAGCGADQNPLPRKTVELAKEYGARLADAVKEVLAGEMDSLTPELATRYDEIELPFAEVPDREQLQQSLSDENKYEVRRAKHLLAQLGDDANTSLPETYPYPVQTWKLGEVTGVILGGEVVVDYSLAIKNLPEEPDFVIGYANDVMAYIPSERVLAEGGYEGAGAMVYYGLPSPWKTGIEQRIMETVRSQLQSFTP